MDDLRFRLLGPMEILVEDHSLSLPGSAERALLAQLLLSPGRTIPASTLIDRLWAESTLPVDPTNALQIRVSKLRRMLKANQTPDLVTRDGVGYRADVDRRAVDAIDFADRVRLARAATAVAFGEDSGPEALETTMTYGWPALAVLVWAVLLATLATLVSRASQVTRWRTPRATSAAPGSGSASHRETSSTMPSHPTRTPPEDWRCGTDHGTPGVATISGRQNEKQESTRGTV